MTKFADRYVLGEGYPFSNAERLSLSLSEELLSEEIVKLDYPYELSLFEVPKYRLVLERVDDE